MPEKTKPEEQETQKEPEKMGICEDNNSNWSHDQQEKNYYYDDSHGYEIYDPDEDDEDE